MSVLTTVYHQEDRRWHPATDAALPRENPENLDELHRLRLVLDAIPDESLMRLLERAAGAGTITRCHRMWNGTRAPATLH